MDIDVQNVTYIAPLPTSWIARVLASWGWGGTRVSKRTLLSPIGFQLPHGSITALCGPRGSGRSTLLRILALEQKPTTGQVHFSSETTDGSLVLVRDREPALECLTPYENIYFASRMANPPDREHDSIDQLTGEILESLDLKAHAHIPMEKLGAVDRLCTTLGIALAGHPRMLLLDGITTQLDRIDTLALSLLLRKLADKGCVIVMTVNHLQDHPAAFFNNLVVLAQGKLLYAGQANKCVDFFNKVGCSTSSVDHFLENLARNAKIVDDDTQIFRGDMIQARIQKSIHLGDLIQQSNKMMMNRVKQDPEEKKNMIESKGRTNGHSLSEDILSPDKSASLRWNINHISEVFQSNRETIHMGGNHEGLELHKDVQQVHRLGMGRQVYHLFHRFVQTSWRSGSYLRRTFFLWVLLSVLILAIWANPMPKSQLDATNEMANFLVVSLLFGTLLLPHAKIRFLIDHRAVYTQEQSCRRYLPRSYIVAQMLHSTLETMVLCSVFPLMVVPTVMPFATWTNIWDFYLLLTCHVLTHSALVETTAFLVQSQEQTQSFCLLSGALSFLFAGYWVPRSQIFGSLSWLSNFSYTRYALTGLFTIAFPERDILDQVVEFANMSVGQCIGAALGVLFLYRLVFCAIVWTVTWRQQVLTADVW